MGRGTLPRHVQRFSMCGGGGVLPGCTESLNAEFCPVRVGGGGGQNGPVPVSPLSRKGQTHVKTFNFPYPSNAGGNQDRMTSILKKILRCIFKHVMKTFLTEITERLPSCTQWYKIL